MQTLLRIAFPPVCKAGGFSLQSSPIDLTESRTSTPTDKCGFAGQKSFLGDATHCHQHALVHPVQREQHLHRPWGATRHWSLSPQSLHSSFFWRKSPLSRRGQHRKWYPGSQAIHMMPLAGQNSSCDFILYFWNSTQVPQIQHLFSCSHSNTCQANPPPSDKKALEKIQQFKLKSLMQIQNVSRGFRWLYPTINLIHMVSRKLMPLVWLALVWVTVMLGASFAWSGHYLQL